MVDNEYNCIQSSQLHNKCSNYSTLNVDYDNCKKVNEKVIFVGAWLNVWGHWLTDNIRRLWFINSDMYKQFTNYKLVYTCYNSFKLSKNVIQLLLCLGVNYKHLVRVDELTQFSEIIVPDECFLQQMDLDAFIQKNIWY